MADTTVAAVKKEDEPKKLPNGDDYLRLEDEYAYARANITLPVGWAFEECLRPEFWSQVAHKFQKQTGDRRDRAGAIFVVRTQDHAWIAELYLKAVLDRGLVMRVKQAPVMLDIESADTALYETRWNVGKQAYDIIRRSDREVVGAQKTKEQAAEWIAKTTGVAKAA